MTITPEQRTYARFAGITILVHVVLEGFGDSMTIIARGGGGESAGRRRHGILALVQGPPTASDG